MTLIDLGTLDMVIWRMSHTFTQDVVPFHANMACVMQRIGAFDYLAYVHTSSHTSWTLDDGHMSFHMVDMIMSVDIWEGIPQYG
jgi:hypothetical protein